MANYLFDGLLGAGKDLEGAKTFAQLQDGTLYTYSDVQALSAQYAQALISLGVQVGDRVAVQVPKSINAVMLYLACVRAGAVFLPLNTAYTKAELSYFLSDAGARLFICDVYSETALTPLAQELGVALETLGTDRQKEQGSLCVKAQHSSVDFKNVTRGPNDLAAILYTSGTTGRSKGAMMSHDNLLSNAQTLCDIWHFDKDDVLLHALPIFHTHGLFVAINVVLVSHSSMIFLNQFEVQTVLQHVPDATAMMGVPTFYTRLLESKDFTQDVAAHMRLFISGSAPLLASTHKAFEQRCGKRILERYGMTETNMNTSNPYEGERKAGTVGPALPDVTLKICDPETGEELKKGEIGSIEVKGPNVFLGYWQMPEKTKQEFRSDGFFITGDLGRLDEDGYVQIVGRSKDLIIAGGYNIYPKEVESVLDAETGILESAVIGVPHLDLGEAVVAVVVLIQPTLDQEAFVKELAQALGDKLARFKLPRHIEVVDALPRNVMGKVQKNILRDHYQKLFL